MAELPLVAPRGDPESEWVLALYEIASCLGEEKRTLAGLEWLDFHCPLGACDMEAPVWPAEGVAVIAADGCGSTRVFQHRQLVVRQSNGSEPGVVAESVDCGRHTEQEDDRVDQVASQFKHPMAGVAGQLRLQLSIGQLTYRGVDFGNLAQPTSAVGVKQQLESRVVTEHVTHLNHQPPTFCLKAQRLEIPVGLRARFVEVHVLACLDAGQRHSSRLAERRLNRNNLDRPVRQ